MPLLSRFFRCVLPVLAIVAVLAASLVSEALAQLVSDALPIAASGGMQLAAAAAATVPIILKTPHWDQQKRLYRPGDHEVPLELAREWGYAPAEGESATTSTANSTGGDTGAGDAGGEAGAGGNAGELPEDFPGREHLVGANLTTLDAVRAKSDEELVALPGIGEATVRKIRDALK